MILDDGRVKITDFGIAMALNSNELTQTNSVMGSVHYLPPEQASGSGSTIKSDIYSLGILMYELLTGKVPFKGDNAVEIAIKQMKDQIPSVCEFNPDIPQSIENIVIKACAKNPKNRYDNVQEMYSDLATSMSEERKNELRITHKYPEQDLEETKVMPDLKKLEVSDDFIDKPKKKKSAVNIILVIFASLLALIVAGISVLAIVYPKMSEKQEVVVPDVSDLSVVEAEKKLKEAGLNVVTELEEKNHATIAEGNVISTKPQSGRSVKTNTDITLVVSIGANGMSLDNYVGKNYYEVKGILESNGIYVLVEKKEISQEDKDKVKENIILEQKPVSGTKVVEGDTVTLYIPDIITEYPDFVNESWSVADVETFCTEYNIKLEKKYVESSKTEGSIIGQSRAKGNKVMANTTLIITIAKAPIEDPIEDPIDELLPTE